MSMKKSSRKSNDKTKKVRLPEKSMSFHGHATEEMIGTLRRPRTVPDLVSGRITSPTTENLRPKLTKLLLNVTVQRSLGPVQVIISPESTVGDLISDALRQYLKEGKRPVLSSFEPSDFCLHYSQFSLESLDPHEKLIELGSRSFFLCPKQIAVTMTPASASSSTCSKEVERVGWLRFMDNFLQ